MGFGGLYESLDVFFLGEVCDETLDAILALSKFSGKRIDLLLACGRECNLGAFAEERSYDCGADAARTTRYQNDFVFEFKIHCKPFLTKLKQQTHTKSQKYDASRNMEQQKIPIVITHQFLY